MASAGRSQSYTKFYQQILAAYRKHFSVLASREMLRLSGGCLVVLLAYIGAEFLFDLSPAVRIGLWVLVMALLGFWLLKFFLPVVQKIVRPTEPEVDRFARRLGKHAPEVADDMVNFLQLNRGQGISGHPALRELSLRQLYRKIEHIRLDDLLQSNILKRPALRSGLLLLAILLLFAVSPGSVSLALQKLIHPSKDFVQPLPISLKIDETGLEVLKNDPVLLRGHYQGLPPAKLWVVIDDADDAAENELKRIALSAGPGSEFTHRIPNVQGGFRYWFEAQIPAAGFKNKIAASDTGVVMVRERPYVRELQAKLSYPAYTRLPALLLPPNNGEITALVGSEVRLEIEANKRLSQAWIAFKDSTNLPMAVRENRATVTFRVERDAQYQVYVVDEEEIPNYQPVTYSIFALGDELPYVEISKPGQDLDLGDSFVLPMLINLRDDFGFSRLQIKGRHVRAGASGDTVEFAVPVSYQSLDQNTAIAQFDWDISGLYMIPDDYIEYYAEVFDNDRVSGPKRGQSRTFIIRLPSLTEFLTEAGQELSEQLEETDELRKETEELREKLEEINREMKREKELTWERRKEIEDQIANQKNVQEKIEEIQKELEQMVNNLDEQRMLSPETLQKYMELQEMLSELATPELKEAMEKLQKALENQNMEQVRKAMENFQLSVEEFEQRIDRAHELFKQVQLEQKMDQLANLAEKLAEEQKEINNQAEKENLSESEQEQLADKEGNLEKNTEFFEEKLDEAAKEFQEEMAEIAEQLQKAQEFSQENQLTQQMRQMQQEMREGEMQQAQKSGENLEKQLEMLQSMMQQAQQSMNQTMKEEILQAMQKVQQDMLSSSFRQEHLMKRSQNADVASSQVTDIARKQSQMRENTENIIRQMLEIAKKTFFISPQMSQILASLRNEMSDALDHLENRNTHNAARSQQQAMALFNQAIMSMQSSMSQLSQSNSASGFQEMMEQLQQMAGQQGELNQQTMSMMPQPGQGQQGSQPSPESLARLAAQQEMIRRSLESLNQQQGERGDVLGRLGELGEEMEKVIDDLRKQQLNPKVIERQQRILSRLLDAQKSVREKEHSKKRLAEREDNVIAKSPPQLRQEMIDRENRFRKEMLNAMKEGYSAEYKEYIKNYYELLSRQPQKAQ